MEVTVTIPDELAARAKSRGMRIEDYVVELLARQLEAQHADAPRMRSPEEIRTWLDALAQFSDKIPALPEVITRDWIYQDHN
jgi:post-segregation antitoxin (ccd killing protein)